MDAQIADHRVHPRDDLTSFLIDAEIGGSKLAEEHIRGTMTLLMVAGIDTTWSAIGASLWHLARHPADRRRLAAEPELMPPRWRNSCAPTRRSRWLASWPGTSTSTATRSRRATGCCCRSRRPTGIRAVFENPDQVQLDRAKNRHAAFGLGRHRCLGSNLARMELRVALEEWVARYPDFELSDPAGVTWQAGRSAGRARSRSASWVARPRKATPSGRINKSGAERSRVPSAGHGPQTVARRQAGGQGASVSRCRSSPNGRSPRSAR